MSGVYIDVCVCVGVCVGVWVCVGVCVRMWGELTFIHAWLCGTILRAW